MRDRIGVIETALYLIVGVFLVAAGGLILFDAVKGLIDGLGSRTNFLFELGLLALLVVAFSVSIYLIRRGAAAERAVGMRAED